MNKSRKKGINARERSKENLVSYKDLERNLLTEISKELTSKNDKKNNNGKH